MGSGVEAPRRLPSPYPHHLRGYRLLGRRHQEGTPKVYDLPADGLGWSRKYSPKAIPVHEDIDESIELHEESSEDLNASFNVTNRTSIKVEAKGGVDGIGEASASAESETTSSVGGGWGRASSSSRTISHKVKTSVDVQSDSRCWYRWTCPSVRP